MKEEDFPDGRADLGEVLLMLGCSVSVAMENRP